MVIKIEKTIKSQIGRKAVVIGYSKMTIYVMFYRCSLWWKIKTAEVLVVRMRRLHSCWVISHRVVELRQSLLHGLHEDVSPVITFGVGYQSEFRDFTCHFWEYSGKFLVWISYPSSPCRIWPLIVLVCFPPAVYKGRKKSILLTIFLFYLSFKNRLFGQIGWCC